MPNDETTTKHLLLFMLAAYLFSFAVRMIWVYQFQGAPSFHWDGQLMINTNDGYFFASGAQQYLEGTLAHNPRVPELFYTAVITLTAFVAKYTPLALDTVTLYMPAVIASLVVIPVILIGRLLGSTLVGFLAALIGSVAWSYYNRTMVGYFDTDMFSAMAPMFILYFLLAMIKTERLRFALYGSLAFLIYPYLYDQGRAVVYAMGLIYMGYMLLFHRRDDFTYYSILLVSLGLMKVNIPLQLIAIMIVYFLIVRSLVEARQAMWISVATVLAFLYTGDVFDLIVTKVSEYAVRGTDSEGLHFFQVHQTVREAGKIPFDVFANRISGSIPGLLAALIGYILLVVRHREMILALPLIGIGLFALIGGLRFTVYAVPVAALSAVYLFHTLGRFSDKKSFQLGMPLALSALLLYPNIAHIIDYKVPTVFNSQEVATLDRLKGQGSDKDYVIAWWDYGYPIWYYANKNTLIDGGKHNHDNFIVSEILTTSSQLEAARLSRIATEQYVVSDYRIIADSLFKNDDGTPLHVGDYLETLRYGDVTLPEKRHEVYLYLPLRMLDIFPTVQLFSNLDLNSGEQGKRPFFYMTAAFKDGETSIELGRGVALLKQEGVLQIGQQKVPVHNFYRTQYDASGKLHVERQQIHSEGLNLLYLASYNRFLVLDDTCLNSTYIQLFLLEQYDRELFEPVILDPLTKIYRLKI